MTTRILECIGTLLFWAFVYAGIGFVIWGTLWLLVSAFATFSSPAILALLSGVESLFQITVLVSFALGLFYGFSRYYKEE